MKQLFILIVITAVSAGVSSFVSSKLRAPAHDESTAATPDAHAPGHEAADKSAKAPATAGEHAPADKAAAHAPARVRPAWLRWSRHETGRAAWRR